jgi:hypothetical protein
MFASGVKDWSRSGVEEDHEGAAPGPHPSSSPYPFVSISVPSFSAFDEGLIRPHRRGHRGLRQLLRARHLLADEPPVVDTGLEVEVGHPCARAAPARARVL